ncbi:hemerythrin domain-containing protein [Allopontixanthobacter sp.]|uniref:hemerythrin domain-containing protein n=1 Tax=Allopontixanthobacter sp. TaxID=2906452 RepID=UPI002ABAC22F|nr:hemerythrin domain-containing protein [Allopontixanthobacter sp.]MDZ4306675.1 hemerythrin domain-containing protein [Allopontixanthobacter sp.]
MPTKNDTDATHILAQDHRKVEELFSKYEKASGRDRKAEIANRICDELKIHTIIEEEIFYPALEGKIEEDLLNEAYVEHDGAKMLVNEIAQGSPDEAFYDAKVTVLKEQIEHHVEEEEKQRNNMFQQARAADVDLEEIGERMLARKEELKLLAEQQGLPAAQMSTAGGG